MPGRGLVRQGILGENQVRQGIARDPAGGLSRIVQSGRGFSNPKYTTVHEGLDTELDGMEDA